MDAVIFSAVAFLSTLTGGLAAARFRTWFGTLAAFVAGVLIAVPLFDLLPEALWNWAPRRRSRLSTSCTSWRWDSSSF